MSPLLRELVKALEGDGGPAPDTQRELLLVALVLDELARSPMQPLGVPLPDPQTGDNRLRMLYRGVPVAQVAAASGYASGSAGEI